MNFTEEQLTAYALGELSETERQQIAEELQNNPEARRTVEEIQALAGRLETELARETAPEGGQGLGRRRIELHRRAQRRFA